MVLLFYHKTSPVNEVSILRVTEIDKAFLILWGLDDNGM